MSNDMKRIMESFRTNVIQEKEELQTVGAVLNIIQKFRQAQAGEQAGKKALEMAAEQIPGISNIWSIVKGAKEAKDMLSTLYGLEDKFKSNTGLDKLNIDDNISKIVDDKVEAAFLNFLIDKLGKIDKPTWKNVNFLSLSTQIPNLFQRPLQTT